MKTQAVLFMTIISLAEVAWTASEPYKLAPEDEYELKYGRPEVHMELSRVPAEDSPESPTAQTHSFKPQFEKGRF